MTVIKLSKAIELITYAFNAYAPQTIRAVRIIDAIKDEAKETSFEVEENEVNHD